MANDYTLIGSLYAGNPSTSNWSIERRFTSNGDQNRIGIDYDVLDVETETDVDFMMSLYRNSNPDYFLGSWIIRPMIDILVHYMGYPRITSDDKNLEKDLNQNYSDRRSAFNQLMKELSLFGEEYVLVSYDSDFENCNLKPRNKNFILETKYDDYNNPDDITYVKIKEVVESRTASGNSENVIFIKTYWKTINPKYAEAVKKGFIPDGLERFDYWYKVEKKVSEKGNLEVLVPKSPNPYKCIPVIPMHQNRFSTDANGYSDASGLIRLCGVYHQVFESMIDTNIYNGKPTMVFSGLTNAEKFVSSTYGEISPETGDVTSFGSYELFGSYYLEGNARAEYLQVGNSYIEGAKEILRLLFYIFVQTGEVPEWAYGAHIDGTWASTKMQSTPLIQKIESKRLDINDAMMKLNRVMAKILEVNHDNEYSTYRTGLEWSEPLPEDREYILSCIDKIIPLDVLTNEKILELLDIVDDPKAEIAKREKEKKKEQTEQNKLNQQAIIEKMREVQNKKAVGDDSEEESDEEDIVNENSEEETEEKTGKTKTGKKEEKQKPDADVKKKNDKKAKGKKATKNNAEVGEMEDFDEALKELIGEDYNEELGLDE